MRAAERRAEQRRRALRDELILQHLDLVERIAR
jgi:hypothetical protein